MSKATDLCDAIVTLLNADDNDFSLKFNARRLQVPVVDQTELTDLNVTVFAGTRSAEIRTRGEFARTYKPIVAIQKRITAANDTARIAEVDGLQTLVEEIETALESPANSQQTDLEFLGYDGGDVETYASGLLLSDNVFASILTLTYQS